MHKLKVCTHTHVPMNCVHVLFAGQTEGGEGEKSATLQDPGRGRMYVATCTCTVHVHVYLLFVRMYACVCL